MAEVLKSVLVPYSAQKMFDLVDGVERYPEFLPWCGGTTLKQRTPEKTAATIVIDFMSVKATFSTENAKEAPHFMDIRLTDGPFTRLEGFWRFTELAANACKIKFRLHYQFRSRLLEKAIGPVFGHIANTFVDAFIRRADEKWGQ